MCGVAGILGVDREMAERIAPRMLRAMSHRGPDDQGIEVIADPQGASPPAVLLHRRLSIIDLSAAGHQPMADHPRDPQQRPNWIVFNGEVFNFLELHGELAAAGWECHTRCDTEVILHSYRVHGEHCVERFRGMFAWCLLDSSRGTAWLCRDRLGIKPLYVCRPPLGGLLFASELRTILAAGPELVSPIISPQALESFLAQGAVCGLQSIVQDVSLLGPGESLTVDWSGKELRRKTYWQVPRAIGHAASENGSARNRERSIGELHQILRDAVRLRMIADVPLGLFLSGGIDSAAIAAVATEGGGADVRTINIGFDQPEYDESEQAAAVAADLGTSHQTVRLGGQDILDDVDAVLAAVDQPTVDGVNTYFVSRAARRAGLTVALSGLGGDELFGGYASFRDVPRAMRWHRRLRMMGPGRRVLSAALAMSGRRSSHKAVEMLRRAGTLAQLYLLRRELFLPEERRSLQVLPAECDPSCGLTLAALDEFAAHTSEDDPINSLSRFELTSYMRHMLLRDGDVFSMAHALEVRFPLLDHILVEHAMKLPGRWKRPDPRPKPMLIDAAGSRFPQRVSMLPKRGFTVPWPAWLRGPLRMWAREAISDADVWKSLGFDGAAPLRLWERFSGGDERIAGLQVLALVVLANFTRRHQLRAA